MKIVGVRISKEQHRHFRRILGKDTDSALCTVVRLTNIHAFNYLSAFMNHREDGIFRRPYEEYDVCVDDDVGIVYEDIVERRLTAKRREVLNMIAASELANNGLLVNKILSIETQYLTMKNRGVFK